MPRGLSSHVDSPRKVGKRLREARIQAGLSQRQLSFPGCTAAYISRIEAGERTPSLQMINELADRLHVHPVWLARDGSPGGDGPDGLHIRRLETRIAELEEALRSIRQQTAVLGD